uniref:CHC2 zinc finger domain-containing protein n=1 Tax=uncultured Bilophila sp. TaxID=529385 RepID=UPI00345B5974
MWPGFSINFLSASERERIAQELLFEVQPAAPGHCFTSACPFHSEKTPGGAFWYDPERNSAHCYSCDTHGNLIDIFCAVNGYDEGSSEGFKAFLGPKVLSHYFTNFSKSSRDFKSTFPFQIAYYFRYTILGRNRQ